MRKLALSILAVVWVLALVVCATGEWIDAEGYPVSTPRTIGDIL